MSGEERPVLRVRRTRAQAQRSYGRLSRWYDLLEGGGERRIARLAIEALGVRPGERAVEIGPGTGQGVCALATAAGAAGVVCAVDLVPRMIARTRARAQRERPPRRAAPWPAGPACPGGGRPGGRQFEVVRRKLEEVMLRSGATE